MIESKGFQDLGGGCIRNNAVLLFDVEKGTQRDATNVFI